MSNIPKTYKAARQIKKGEPFQLVDIDYKEPKSTQVIVKVLACGVCRSDDIVKEEIMPVLPRIPGHEIVGDVVAVGDAVSVFKVGDRVGSGWHGGHCHACSQCAKGDYVTCENENINGIMTDGGYAEYATLEYTAVAKIPTEIDPAEAAPLFCAGVTTFNSIRNMNLKPGATLAVNGLGGLGHLAVQFAAKSGYNVVALSSSDSKRKLAAELGAKHYVDGSKENLGEALQKLGGADLVVCTAPSADLIKSLIPGLNVNGTILILAVMQEDISFPSMPLIQKRLSVRGWPSGTAEDSRQTVQFAIEQGVQCQIERFSLEDVDAAYEAMISGKARFRSVLVPGYKK